MTAERVACQRLRSAESAGISWFFVLASAPAWCQARLAPGRSVHQVVGRLLFPQHAAELELGLVAAADDLGTLQIGQPHPARLNSPPHETFARMVAIGNPASQAHASAGHSSACLLLKF